MTGLASDSLIRRASSRLGSRLVLSLSAPLSIGVWLLIAGRSVHPVNDSGQLAVEPDEGVLVLVEAGGQECLSDDGLNPVPVGSVGWCHRNTNVFRDLFIAVDTGNFLHQVNFPCQVPPPAGGGYCQL